MNVSVTKPVIRGELLMDCGFEVLVLGTAQLFCGDSDSTVGPVDTVADRVDRALDVHVCHGCHHDGKLKVVPVIRVESTLLTFAHLVLIFCVNEIHLHEAH